MHSTLLSLLYLASLPAAPEVTLRPLEGDSLTGRLTSLGSKQLALETKTGEASWETSRLMWIEMPQAASSQKPSVWVDLVDGSRLQVAGYTASAGTARLELTTGQTVEMPTRAIHTVRFREQSPELAAQWRGITASLATGDVVVVRKTSMRTVERGEEEPTTIVEHALDQLEGTLHDVTAAAVQFEVDGDKVGVRREKLEGLVYYRPAKREFPPPVCRLVDAAGSSWLVRDVQLDEGQFVATTTGGIDLRLPVNAVAKIDFSVGNVAFLAELEPDTGGGDLALSLQPAAMSYKFSRVFQARARPPLGADAFRIGGKRFEGGLSLHSPAKLVYRVPEGFRRFRAVAGVDDSVIAPGRFDLVILGDGKPLARHSFSVAEPRQPLTIDLDLAGIRRLTIAVEAAAGQDFGDQLDLCEARFTK